MSATAATAIVVESLRPRLAPGTEIVEAGPGAVYLKNSESRRLLRLTGGEERVARLLDGEHTLADVLQQCMGTSGTPDFHTVFDLLVRLKSARLLSPESAEHIRTTLELYRTSRRSARIVRRVRHLADIDVRRIDSFFVNPFLRALAGAVTSLPGLAAAAAIAAVGFADWALFETHNLFLGFAPDRVFSAHARYVSYLAAVASLWATFCAVLTVRNLLGAYVLSHHGCKPLSPRIRFAWGLLFFDVELDDILRAGRSAALRLHTARILFPLALAGLSIAFWAHFSRTALLPAAAHACIMISLVGLSPLLPTDLSRILDLTSPDARAAEHSVRFLRNRFLLELFRFGRSDRTRDRHLLTSALALAWLYIAYAYFWTVVSAGLAQFVVDVSTGWWPGRLLVLTCLALMAAPPLLLIGGMVTVGALNIRAVVRSPMHRMTRLGRQIRARSVPPAGQVVRFLRQIPLFSNLTTGEIHTLCRHLRLLRVPGNRDVVVQGEPGDAFYTVVHGRLAVVKEETTGERRAVALLGIGDSFGEIALTEQTPRTATVRTLERSVLLQLEKKYFDKFVLESAGGRDKITDMIRQGTLIMGMPVFAGLSPSQVNALVSRLVRRDLLPGERVFSQGDPGDRFYIVREGSVRVARTEDNRTVMERNLHPGDFFGEIALIKNVPRTATVTACERTVLLSLDKDAFYGTVGASLLTGAQIEMVARERLGELGVEVTRLC